MIGLILLDRDGVLNHESDKYVKSPDELIMIDGAAAAVARINRAGIPVALCTNQSAVGRGIIDLAMLEHIHAKLRAELARAGGRIDEIYFCPDPPGMPSTCRKPLPGMLQAALRRFDVAAANAPMIGDQLRDLQAAAAIGCPRHLVRTGNGVKTQSAGVPQDVLPVAVHNDLAAAITALLGPA
jgi:D-glycero-D-manno-heptose 1,7-bisphosphate phosphatase